MTLTADAVATYVLSVQGIREALTEQIRAFWGTLPSDPVAASGVLAVAVPEVVDTYGTLASLAAIDFYSQVRGSSTFRPQLPRPVPDRQVAASVRWAISPLFDPSAVSQAEDGLEALTRVVTITDRNVANQGHETIYQSGIADPRQPKFARVPVGDTCAWCRLMASRGAVFRTEATAKFRRSHAKCDCKVSPVFDGEDLPYDRQALLDEYQAARDKASKGSIKAITAEIRKGSEAN